MVYLKKILCLCFIFLILSGCENSKPLTVKSNNFSSIIDISYGDFNYQYKVSFNQQGTTFTPCGDTLPIEFKINNLDIVSSYLKNSINYNEILERSPVNILNEILLHSNGKTVYPDYNNRYILYEVCKYGDYTLTLSKDNLPSELKVDSLKLFAKFSNMKEGM